MTKRAVLLAGMLVVAACAGETEGPASGAVGSGGTDAGSGGASGSSGASGAAAAGGSSGDAAGGASGAAGQAGQAGHAGASGARCEPTGPSHAFDLADHAPEPLTIMFSMSWFGIPSSDRNGGGSDAGWGNWKWGSPPCVAVNDPNACVSVNGRQERAIAATQHPLAGIYSSSARDAEGRQRVDLMLSTLRRPCDPGARVDAWSVQMNSVKFSSAHVQPGDPGYSVTADVAYLALVAFLDRAEAAGMRGVIVPGVDTTWYWHFGDGKGLTTHAAKLAALEDDIVELATLASKRTAALTIRCRPLLYLYTGGTSSGPYISVADWKQLLESARERLGSDFYTIGATTNPVYFEVFDGIAPWLQTGVWQQAQGDSVRARAVDWTARRHDGVLGALSRWPGRIVLGGVAPGFDDYTKNWGACTDRSIPRDPGVLDGQFDYFASARDGGGAIRGLFLETWDDWTEGSQLEPSVEEGAGKLVHLKKLIASYYGETIDPADTRMEDRWTAFGQPRNCGNEPVRLPPSVDLTCP
jgi:hypothetical protein